MFITLIILPALLSTTVSGEATPPGTTDAFSLFEPMPAAASSLAHPALPEPVLVEDEYHEHSPWYLRINAGGVTTRSSNGPGEDIDFDEGWLAAVAIGERVTSGVDPLNFALELEGVWTQQDAKDNPALSDVTTASAYLNGVFDFRLAERFSLYAGAGIGAAWMNVGTNSDSLHDFSDEDGPFLTWQLKAGLLWHLSPNLGLSLGYRFRNIDDNQIDNGIDNSSFDLKTEQHIAEVGLQFGW